MSLLRFTLRNGDWFFFLKCFFFRKQSVCFTLFVTRSEAVQFDLDEWNLFKGKIVKICGKKEKVGSKICLIVLFHLIIVHKSTSCTACDH